jgi:diguanylate cyclase (GGDEF)-like protein
LLAVFQDSIICDNKSVHVRPSIGVSIYPNDSEDEEELMRLADIALYKAKENGNIFVVYEESPGKQLWLDNLQ